jgi:glycerophosphoryl diester phosphodiesterase
VYVEVKAGAIEDALLRVLDRHPAARVAVHAFDHRIPVRVRASRPSLPIGILSASYPLDVSGMVRAARADALWQHTGLVDQALVRTAHDEGARVIAWTENDPAHARALLAMGVDALCTDTPGLLRAALAA